MNDRLEQLFSAQVKKSPEARAVVCEKDSITYRELEYQSTRLANALLAKGLLPGSRVCFLLPKSIEAIVSIIAILKAGCTYVPLDLMTPASRLALTLKRIESSWLISGPGQETLIERSFSELSGGSIPPVVCWLGKEAPQNIKQYIGLSQPYIDAANDLILAPAADPTEIAYVIFTSGSTGQPKGVINTHVNVTGFLAWVRQQFPVDGSDKVSSHPPLHFDISVWDVFGTLTSGAELHLFPARLNLLPQLVAGFIRDSGITQWISVPSILVSMTNRGVVGQGDFPHLKRLMWGGEVFPTIFLQQWMRRLPHVTFTNIYGPAEATIGCSYYTMPGIPEDTSIPVPIGKPVTGSKMMILDEAQQPVLINEVGNLYLGGAGLSPGYWKEPELTAAVFSEIPLGSGQRWYSTGDLAKKDANGIFTFCGRADRQIKSRGYRIELDDVGFALSRVPGIAESAIVSVAGNEFEGNQICAAYVLHAGATLAPTEIKTALAVTLPFYMLPRLWMELDELPKNNNGKTEYNQLKQMFLNNQNAIINA